MADYKVKAEGLNEALSTFFAITPPHLKPIKSGDTQPGDEDVDERGRCWWFFLNHRLEPCWVLGHPSVIDREYCTHWLPFKHIANP